MLNRAVVDRWVAAAGKVLAASKVVAAEIVNPMAQCSGGGFVGTLLQ